MPIVFKDSRFYFSNSSFVVKFKKEIQSEIVNRGGIPDNRMEPPSQDITCSHWPLYVVFSPHTEGFNIRQDLCSAKARKGKGEPINIITEYQFFRALQNPDIPIIDEKDRYSFINVKCKDDKGLINDLHKGLRKYVKKPAPYHDNPYIEFDYFVNYLDIDAAIEFKDKIFCLYCDDYALSAKIEQRGGIIMYQSVP